MGVGAGVGAGVGCCADAVTRNMQDAAVRAIRVNTDVVMLAMLLVVSLSRKDSECVLYSIFQV